MPTVKCIVIVKISWAFFWCRRKIKAYRAFLQWIINQTTEIKAKKLKVCCIVIDKMVPVNKELLTGTVPVNPLILLLTNILSLQMFFFVQNLFFHTKNSGTKIFVWSTIFWTKISWPISFNQHIFYWPISILNESFFDKFFLTFFMRCLDVSEWQARTGKIWIGQVKIFGLENLLDLKSFGLKIV